MNRAQTCPTQKLLCLIFARRKYKDVKIEKCRNILRLLEIAFHRFFCTTICICGAGMYLMGDLGSWKDQAVCYPLVVRSQDRAEREWGGGNSIQTENTVSLFFLVCWTDWDYISVCLENSYFPGRGNKLWKEASNLLQWNWKMRIIDEKERKSKESWCNRCCGSEILIFNARTRSWIGIWGNMSSWQKLRRGGELRVEGDWDCMRGNTRASESEGGWWRRVQKKEKRLRVWEAVERRWRLREGGVSLRANRVAGGDRKY